MRSRTVLRRSDQVIPLLPIRRRLYHEVSFVTNGKPTDVLEYRSSRSSPEPPSPDAILLQVHHVPWNPADVNVVQGNYPSPYPSGEDFGAKFRSSSVFSECKVAGSEGYGCIEEVLPSGDSTTTSTTPFKVGSWVTFALPGLGTLRSTMWLPPEALLPIRRGSELFEGETATAASVASASCLFQLGGTAWRMLSDFVKLKPGDVVIQNAGNSGVGILASQLAKRIESDVKVVSMVRRGDRTGEAVDELKSYLHCEGKADLVLFEEDLIEHREAFKAVKSELCRLSSRPPTLALNSVGGASSNLLLQLLGEGATHVTYGGMSKQPVSLATSQLIFKDIKAVGYWNSRWMAQRSSILEKFEMLDELVDAFLDDKLHVPPVEVFSLSDVKDALHYGEGQSKEPIRRKTVFDCREANGN